MNQQQPDKETLEIIYKEVFHQFRGAWRTYETMRQRLGQIIGFIGVILNLELLGILQIMINHVQVQQMTLLVVSIIFIVISLILAVYSFFHAPFKTLTSSMCLEKKFIQKSPEDLLISICEDRIKDINENKKILHKKAIFVHVSMYTLLLAITLVAIFILINISDTATILLITVIAIIIAVFLYYYENLGFSKLLGIDKSKK